jgi:hypothetical protein
MDIYPYSVFNLHIFDESGTELVKLDTLQKSKLYYSEKHLAYILEIVDPAYHTDLLALTANKHKKNDFHSKLSNRESFTVTSPKKEDFKIICTLLFCDDQENPTEAYIEIPKAELISGFELETTCTYHDIKSNKTVFKVIPNELDEHFDLHIEKFKG